MVLKMHAFSACVNRKWQLSFSRRKKKSIEKTVKNWNCANLQFFFFRLVILSDNFAQSFKGVTWNGEKETDWMVKSNDNYKWRHPSSILLLPPLFESNVFVPIFVAEWHHLVSLRTFFLELRWNSVSIDCFIRSSTVYGPHLGSHLNSQFLLFFFIFVLIF